MDTAVLGDRLPEVTQKPFHSLLFKGRRGGQQQFATQTLHVHLFGLDTNYELVRGETVKFKT